MFNLILQEELWDNIEYYNIVFFYYRKKNSPKATKTDMNVDNTRTKHINDQCL